MKEIVCILSAIMLYGTFCFGQGFNFEFSNDTTIKLQDQFDMVLKLDSTLINTNNKNLTVKSSNDAVVNVDTLVYERDSTKANIQVTAIGYGYANIFVICNQDTISRKIIVSDDNIVEVMSNIIVSLRSQLSQTKDQVSELQEEKTKNNVISIVFAALGLVFALVLLMLLILSKKDAKKQNSSSQSYINQLKNNKVWEQNEKSSLVNQVNTLSSENKSLNDEIEILRAEVHQNRQKQKGNDEQKSKPLTPALEQPQLLYADAIIDGKFNRVKEQPDDDTIFELKLSNPNKMRANVTIYALAHRRVIVNPSFLEGCEKQILGSTTVTMLREGVAQKDSSGKWIITTTPEVKIS